MSPERLSRIEELYHLARERKPRERAAFLADACQGDLELRTEIESLLAQQSEPMFDQPAWEKEPGFLTARTLSPGSQIGPYRVVGTLGSGGMGVVYLAHDSRLRRDVAIKFLSEQMARDPQSRARFQREARAVAALSHPNICPLFDVGPDYLVMEYIEGQTLAARIEKGPLPRKEALTIAIAIAGALGAAHRKGIVHRDLKPGNIMYTEAGAKLLDFGLATFQRRLVDEETMTFAHTGTGQIIGTLPYISPEQLEGKEASARSDIFAFGAVLYEMLTGRRAFPRRSTLNGIVAMEREQPKSLHKCVKDVPDAVERMVRRCLRDKPEERYASMSEIEQELEECRWLLTAPVSGINLKVLVRQSKRPKVAVPLLVALLALGFVAVWWLHRFSRAQWARNEALPRIALLADQARWEDAYALAVQADQYIPNDPMLRKFWPIITSSASIHTTPSGVSVFAKKYNAPNEPWKFIGRSPLENLRMPPVDTQWKLEAKGFATLERASTPDDSLTETMVEQAKAPAGMVRIDFPNGYINVGGLVRFEEVPPVPSEDYWIDKYEVTNAEFKRFLDVGGYRKLDYWKQEFRKDGRLLSWADAMALFRDTTGQPGPATWVQGEYPRGQEDFPVTGVSWFEAAAYAEFVGKSLPTIFHWNTAASPWFNASMIPASNFGGQGPARVGTYHGMSQFGAYDMAGNVKEWCWNEANSGKRYIMGGAWDEPDYMFNDPDARSPFQRSANFGFRCAKYSTRGDAAKALNPVISQARDLTREKPVSNELFQVYKGLYSYDKKPLQATVESIQQTEYWQKEKITFAAAYGNERIVAFLFLPKRASPPFQTIVYFPGAEAFELRSMSDEAPGIFGFVVKSGRALMFPAYKSTFERRDDFKSVHPDSSSAYRDHVIAWSKDLGRSIDYLESRLDIDRNKLAYGGYSWGAALGTLLPAMENRIKACVLLSPGFYPQKSLPEVDQLNFAPQVKVPVLMLNGRFDDTFPVSTSQEPLFHLLGSSKEQKRRVVYETGHDIPKYAMIKEILDWLDRYLGPVK